MAYLTFYIFKFFWGGHAPRPPLEAHAYGTRFSRRLLLYFSRLLQNLLRTLKTIQKKKKDKCFPISLLLIYRNLGKSEQK